MKTDPDLPSDIGPYKKGDVTSKPPRPAIVPPSAAKPLIWLVWLLFVVMLLSPIFGLLIGFIVDTFMTFYNMARGV